MVDQWKQCLCVLQHLAVTLVMCCPQARGGFLHLAPLSNQLKYFPLVSLHSSPPATFTRNIGLLILPDIFEGPTLAAVFTYFLMIARQDFHLPLPPLSLFCAPVGVNTNAYATLHNICAALIPLLHPQIAVWSWKPFKEQRKQGV